jgi:uncharacterized damage-inducible protein DinB
MSHEMLTPAFTRYATGRLDDCLANIERCVGLLTVEQLWERPNEVSNPVGNLVLHLTGNVRQWIVGGLGGEEFDRDRPGEFAERGPLTMDQVLPPLRATVESACRVIEKLDAESLVQEFVIQGRTVTGLAAVFHVVEHFSFHTGQVVSTTKLLTGRDLSLYDAEGRRIEPLPGSSV